jgi:cytochrome b561/polyisoprenoid-binding protein YceI
MSIAPLQYSKAAILLHWALALALAFQIGLGWRLDDVPDAQKFASYQLHKSIGITILVLTLARIAVRYYKPRPAPAADMGWAKRLSKITHAGLYAFMLGVPLSGWAIVSTSKRQVPTMVWDILPLPHLPLGQGLHEPAEFLHEWLTYAGIALFALHVAGALRHHFILRDGLLSRMIPLGTGEAAFQLGRAAVATSLALVIVGGGMVYGRTYLPGKPAASAASPALSSATNAADVAAPAPITDPLASVSPADDAAALKAKTAEEDAAKALAAKEGEGAEKAVPWQIAPGGQLGFVASWSGSAINGRFKSWNGDVTFSPDDLKNSRIRVTVDLISADTDDGERDGSLKGPDFFNTAVSPQATFTSSSISKAGGDSYRAAGTLSLRGKSQPVTLNFTLKFAGDDVTVSGGTSLDRTKFGVGQGQWAATDQIAAKVAVNFNFKARKKS